MIGTCWKHSFTLAISDPKMSAHFRMLGLLWNRETSSPTSPMLKYALRFWYAVVTMAAAD